MTLWQLVLEVLLMPVPLLQTQSPHFVVETSFTVRYAETDAQGRVFFGNYLTYFDVALTEYMRAIKFPYTDMLEAGMDMFYVEANCQYKGAARFDDLLHIHAQVGHIGNTSFKTIRNKRFSLEFQLYKVWLNTQKGRFISRN